MRLYMIPLVNLLTCRNLNGLKNSKKKHIRKIMLKSTIEKTESDVF